MNTVQEEKANTKSLKIFSVLPKIIVYVMAMQKEHPHSALMPYNPWKQM
jgi:hypothetical protein